jgi:hypothetical protein
MPVLEAQLLGTPAITTRFGAMADFTLYGVSVPPLQPCGRTLRPGGLRPGGLRPGGLRPGGPAAAELTATMLTA